MRSYLNVSSSLDEEKNINTCFNGIFYDEGGGLNLYPSVQAYHT